MSEREEFSPKIRVYDNDKSDHPDIPTFDELIEEQGGFGKFQLLAFTTIIFSCNTTGWVTYQYAYLLLYPYFICSKPDGNGNWVTMDPSS